MADISSTVEDVVRGIVSLLKGLIVLFVFANIAFYGIDVIALPDAIGGIINLVENLVSNGLIGLLALLALLSFL